VGVAIAAKTGSADITSRDTRNDDARNIVRKHTWIAGWVPADEPRLVFVVFVHDTMTTSSHGAVYVAQALLIQPEVRAWLTARGVALEEVGQ
jgi:cell division protein FtsI/penicillin-binding protein 2